MSKDEGSVDFEEAGKAALGVLHNLGQKAALAGGLKLDQQVGGYGFVAEEVRKFTNGVGGIYKAGKLVPREYKPESLPHPTAWLGVLIPVGLGAIALTFLLGRLSKRSA